MAVAAVLVRLPRLLGAAVLAAVVAVAWVLPATPSHAAATHTVEVRNRAGGSLHPADLDVHVGDTVVWEWTANEWHDVVVSEHGRSACSPLDPSRAPCGGHTLEVTFEAAGEFGVRDEVTGSAGTVTVTPPPPPKPTPTPTPTPTPSSPSPTTSPSSEPSPSEPAPTGPSESEPDPDPTSPDPTAAPPPDPPPPTPTGGTAAAPRVDSVTPEPTPTVGDPSVASADTSPSPIPAPSFEEFPDPVDPTPVEDVEGDVAVGAPDDGNGQARLLWGMVGGVALLGTLGAFGRSVLFSEPWGA